MKIGIAALLAGAMLIIGGCDRNQTSFVTEPVEIGDIRDAVPAAGRLEALNAVEVRSDKTGLVEAVLVGVNDTVAQGQVLARLSGLEAVVQVERAEALATAAEAGLALAMTRSRESERQLENRRSLVERGFYSQDALLAAQSHHDEDRASVERATADLAAARAELRLRRDEAEARVIRAPISGVVMAVNIGRGDHVGVEGAPLFIMAEDLSSLSLVAEVAEPDLPRVSGDGRVVFTTDAYPTDQFTGRLRYVGREPIIRGALVSYPVTVDINNGDGRLAPGMTAAVEFVNLDVRRVTRIPLQALYFEPNDYLFEPPPDMLAEMRRRGLDPRHPDAANAVEMGMLFARQRRRVFVERNGSWERREVRIGAQSRDHVEVIEGLRPGERVIVREPVVSASASV